MRILAIITVFLLSFAAGAQDTLVLIVDSGVDISHSKLKPYLIPNLAEKNGVSGFDDDGNGFVDDVYGWNFVENRAKLVNTEYAPPEYDDVLKFLDLLGKFQVGGQEAIGSANFLWLRLKVSDASFMNWVNFVGGWAHGTHCAGIVSLDSEKLGIKGITHIPAGEKPRSMNRYVEMIESFRPTNKRSGNRDPFSELYAWFDQMAYEAIQEVKAESAYIGSLSPRVINCSFGSENSHLLAAFKGIMTEQLGILNPSEKDVQKLVNLFVSRVFLPRDKELFKNASNALIVVAAGNSTENNDGIVISPNNVDIPNKIIVGATFDDKVLAPFSCFGKESVDIAVPGVNINSTYPAGKMGSMSGTSMAAPLVSRYAAMVIAENPTLTPVEVKKILMGTVDKKSWLADKTVSGGVANIKRALCAAVLTAEGNSVDQAISSARSQIGDSSLRRGSTFPVDLVIFEMTPEERELYFSAIF